MQCDCRGCTTQTLITCSKSRAHSRSAMSTPSSSSSSSSSFSSGGDKSDKAPESKGALKVNSKAKSRDSTTATTTRFSNSCHKRARRFRSPRKSECCRSSSRPWPKDVRKFVLCAHVVGVCVCARRTSISHLLRAPTSACIDKEEKEIPLPNVKLAILNKVVAYLKYRSNPPA